MFYKFISLNKYKFYSFSESVNKCFRYKSKMSNGVASLEIVKVALSDAGTYTCIAKNNNGQTITSACLKVFADFEPTPAAPVFTKSIKGKEIS